MRLTERSLHVIGRTSLGIPDQLCFRSSSVTAQRYKHTLSALCSTLQKTTAETNKHVQLAVTQSVVLAWNQYAYTMKALLPRSVLGLASSCLNLSSRLFSRTVMGGAPDAFWSEMRATSGMMGRTGRDCCFCSVERTVEDNEKPYKYKVYCTVYTKECSLKLSMGSTTPKLNCLKFIIHQYHDCGMGIN